MFVGLALDEVIQEEKAPLTELTKQRVAIWLSQLEAEGFPLSANVCDRRRLQTAAAAAGENEWYAEWYARLVCWLGAQPLALRQRLRECPAAMTAQLKAYVQAKAPAALPAPPLGAEHWLDSEPGCEWVREQRELQSLPALPELPAHFRFSLPRMPANLLPWGLRKWNELGGGDASSSSDSSSSLEVGDVRAADPRPEATVAAAAAQASMSDETSEDNAIVVDLMITVAAGMAGALATGLVALFVLRGQLFPPRASDTRRRAAPVSNAAPAAPSGEKPAPKPGSVVSTTLSAQLMSA